MADQSSKLGITLAAILACAIVWGWPKVFPPLPKSAPVRSPILAYQSEMQKRVAEESPTGDAVAPAPTQSASYPWQAPIAGYTQMVTQPGSEQPPDKRDVVVVVVVCENSTPATASAAAHEAYGEVRGRLAAYQGTAQPTTAAP